MKKQFIIPTILVVIIVTIFFLVTNSRDIAVVDNASAFEFLEKWISENASPLQSNLNPPATLDQIIEVEEHLGVKFPQKVINAYLIHNGESADSDGLFGCIKWLSLEEIIRVHSDYFQIEKEYQFGNINTDVIIPLFQSGGGDLYYVESGSSGELIEWWHEQPATRNVISNSIETYFIEFVQKLKSGQYVYIENELSALIDKNDL